MFIDSNNFAAGYVYVYIYKIWLQKKKMREREKTYGDNFYPIILPRPQIITYSVPFSLCRTANHHRTGTFL